MGGNRGRLRPVSWLLRRRKGTGSAGRRVLLSRVGVVLPWVLGSGWAIRVDELAAVMVDAAINGLSEMVLGNAEMVKKGKKLLAKSKRGG